MARIVFKSYYTKCLWRYVTISISPLLEKPLRRPCDLHDFPLVNTGLPQENTGGLLPNENRELRGVLDLCNSVLPDSGIGDNGALQLQADYFKDAIEKTREWIVELNTKDNTTIEENEEYIRL